MYLILSFFSTAVSNCFGPWPGFVEDNSSPDWERGDGFRMNKHVTLIVHLPYCSAPGCPFPRKSLALSVHVSPWTIHFQVLDKSPVSGPGRGPPSCNKWRLWRGLFFAETDILTTWGTQGPACLPMDQTQRLQLGPFRPWSPPDTDNCPECPNR